MSQQIPWNDIKESGAVVVDAGTYTVTIESFEEARSTTGKVMYPVILRIVEPSTHTGLPLFERFVVGTDTDPDAADPSTWVSPSNVAARRLKSFLTAAQVPLTGSMDAVRASAIQSHLVVQVTKKVEPALTKKGQPNPYADREFNEIVRFYSMGGPEPHVPAQATSTTNAGAGTAVKAAKLVTCGFCNAKVKLAEYATHASEHEI